jgi:hypothetical protein
VPPEDVVLQEVLDRLLGEGGRLDVQDLELRPLVELAAHEADELLAHVHGGVLGRDELARRGPSSPSAC